MNWERFKPKWCWLGWHHWTWHVHIMHKMRSPKDPVPAPSHVSGIQQVQLLKQCPLCWKTKRLECSWSTH